MVILPNFSQFIPPLRRHCKQSKLILMMQCDWLTELDKKVIDQRLNKVNAICGCSSYIVNNITKCFPSIEGNASVLYNGCNITFFKSDNRIRSLAQKLKDRMNLGNRPLLLYVGRIEPEKGLHVLLTAMGNILSIFPDTILLIIGSISSQPPTYTFLKGNTKELDHLEQLRIGYATYLKNLISPYKENILLLGKIPHYDLPIYYNLADIFVHPAIWNEPFGMVITEAMACSCPVVSTKVGGIKEIVVDGETGYLALPNSVESLQDAIISGLKSHRQLRRMGRNARKRVEGHFSWQHTYSKMMDIINDL